MKKNEGNKTVVIRNVGTNKGKNRLWLEGECLLSQGWHRGTRYNTQFTKTTIVYETAKDGRRAVAGTATRPIIDTVTNKISEAVGNGKTRVTITPEKITIRETK